MPTNCCVPYCSHSVLRTGPRPKCLMKRFPRDPVRCALWEEKIRSFAPKDWVRKSWQALCDCHFDKDQWENRLDGLRKLRPNAVPLIFPKSPRSRGKKIEDGTTKRSSFTHKDQLNMVHSCCAVMCNHTSNTCKLKRFPTDSKRAKVWQMNIGRPGWVRTASSYVCECHFDEEQFELNRLDGLRKLRPDAVPLIFPTHVLVVHDPSKKKWHCPKPRPPDDWNRSAIEEKEPEVQVEVDEDATKDHQAVNNEIVNNEIVNNVNNESFETNNGSFSYHTDHQYSKDADLDTLDADFDTSESDDASQMCTDFCSPSDLKEIESLAQASLDKDGYSESDGFESADKDVYDDIEIVNNIGGDSNVSKSPLQDANDKDTCEEEEEELESTMAGSPTQNNKPQETQETFSKTPPEQRDKADNLPVEVVATPDIWSPFDVDSSVLTTLDVDSSTLTSQLLKDALSFLQFMLPQKWMAVSEDGGIHAFLLSRTRAKAIQRSVFVHLSGGEVELYIHAVRLPRDHEIFQFITTIEPLTQDSLGDFVDNVINIIDLFVSYKTCCGASHKQLLKEWRKYDDCILDSNLFGEDKYFQTVRSKKCLYFACKDSDRCKSCDSLFQRCT